MAKIVKWTKRGLRTYVDQLEFREQSYSDEELNKLQDLVDSHIDQLTRYPDRGLKSAQLKTVRRITIQNTLQLYYRVVGSVLLIVYFSDSRQSPVDNPYR